MEVNLYELWIYSKDKLIYLGTIILIIYFICKYSNNLLSRFKILNNIKVKITELEKIKELDNFYINQKKTQVNDISSKVMYQQNINNSLNGEYNEVQQKCNDTHKKYLNNLNTLSINVPGSIRNKLKSYIGEMEEAQIRRKQLDEKNAQLEYERQNKEKDRQLQLIKDAVAARNRRAAAIAEENRNIQRKKHQLKQYIMRSANKISDCNQRRQYLINMESTLDKSISGQYHIQQKYKNYNCRPKISFFCIKEDTLISLPNNQFKKVKDIHIGDTIQTINNNTNKVLNIHKEFINKDVIIYGINDIEPFFTETHPIVSAQDTNNVFSINPELTLYENPERKDTIKKLQIGDLIYINNKKIKVENITSKILGKNTYVYDLILENFDDYTYIANNVLIESQEPKWFKYPQITGILTDILMNNKYEDIDIKLINEYKNNNYLLNDVIIFYEIIKTYNKNDYDAFFNKLNKLWIKYYNIIYE